MVLLYMVLHGSHQYTPSHVSINIPAPYMDPSWDMTGSSSHQIPMAFPWSETYINRSMQTPDGDGSKPCTPGEHQNSW